MFSLLLFMAGCMLAVGVAVLYSEAPVLIKLPMFVVIETITIIFTVLVFDAHKVGVI